jgi:hypothetical protein
VGKNVALLRIFFDFVALVRRRIFFWNLYHYSSTIQVTEKVIMKRNRKTETMETVDPTQVKPVSSPHKSRKLNFSFPRIFKLVDENVVIVNDDGKEEIINDNHPWVKVTEGTGLHPTQFEWRVTKLILQGHLPQITRQKDIRHVLFEHFPELKDVRCHCISRCRTVSAKRGHALRNTEQRFKKNVKCGFIGLGLLKMTIVKGQQYDTFTFQLATA